MSTETIISEIIQIDILVTLLKSQNMKTILIYFKANLSLYTSSLELLNTTEPIT